MTRRRSTADTQLVHSSSWVCAFPACCCRRTRLNVCTVSGVQEGKKHDTDVPLSHLDTTLGVLCEPLPVGEQSRSKRGNG
ncbi:hypothetical protein LY76DRAFT_388459 [Colletotrichum caudatum]|nr:hypothetical protein LY76DRAFT_388459 [Colletotrichum caudatum]